MYQAQQNKWDKENRMSRNPLNSHTTRMGFEKDVIDTGSKMGATSEDEVKEMMNTSVRS